MITPGSKRIGQGLFNVLSKHKLQDGHWVPTAGEGGGSPDAEGPPKLTSDAEYKAAAKTASADAAVWRKMFSGAGGGDAKLPAGKQLPIVTQMTASGQMAIEAALVRGKEELARVSGAKLNRVQHSAHVQMTSWVNGNAAGFVTAATKELEALTKTPADEMVGVFGAATNASLLHRIADRIAMETMLLSEVHVKSERTRRLDAYHADEQKRDAARAALRAPRP